RHAISTHAANHAHTTLAERLAALSTAVDPVDFGVVGAPQTTVFENIGAGQAVRADLRHRDVWPFCGVAFSSRRNSMLPTCQVWPLSKAPSRICSPSMKVPLVEFRSRT